MDPWYSAGLWRGRSCRVQDGQQHCGPDRFSALILRFGLWIGAGLALDLDTRLR